MAELKDPIDFPKALALLQTIDMTLSIIAGVVIHRCAGFKCHISSTGLYRATNLPHCLWCGSSYCKTTLNPLSLDEGVYSLFDLIDRYRRCYQQPRRRQVNLHPYIRRNRPHAQARSGCHWFPCWPHCLPLDYRVDYCLGDPCLQQPPYPYCMLQPAFFKSFRMLTNGRLLFSEACSRSGVACFGSI